MEEVKQVVENIEDKVEAIMNEAEETTEKVEKAVVDEAQALGVALKEQIKGKVTKVGAPGALVDIGKDKPAVLHISEILRPEGKENCNNTEELLNVGDEVDVYVKRVKDGLVQLTMIKPLALEWREIKKDMVVKGVVTKLEKFGAFVEIGAERPGLVHISEMSKRYIKHPMEVVSVGDTVKVRIIKIDRDSQRVGLTMKL